jgi:hypothetical protein
MDKGVNQLKKALVDFYNQINEEVFARHQWEMLPKARYTFKKKDSKERTTFSFLKMETGTVMAVSTKYRRNYNEYIIEINNAIPQFKEWRDKLQGFELDTLHEMVHIWVLERQREYRPRKSEDWNCPYFLSSKGFWSDHYIAAIPLMGKLIEDSQVSDISQLFYYISSHPVEFFTMCYIISLDIIERPELFRQICPELAKTYPGTKDLVFESMVNKLYGYTTVYNFNRRWYTISHNHLSWLFHLAGLEGPKISLNRL